MRRTRYLTITIALAALIAGPGCAKKGEDAAGGDASGHGAQADQFGRMSVEELEAKMKEAKEGKIALHVFDNNRKEVFAEGHIPGAKWLDSDSVKASDLPADKEATLVFYCANEH